MSYMSQDYIWIVTEDTEETAKTTLEGQRGFRENFQQQISDLKQVKLNPAELERKMTDFLQVVGRLFKQAEQQAQIESQNTLIQELTTRLTALENK